MAVRCFLIHLYVLAARGSKYPLSETSGEFQVSRPTSDEQEWTTNRPSFSQSAGACLGKQFCVKPSFDFMRGMRYAQRNS